MSTKPVIRNIALADLVRYRLPPPGMLSILHRVSGALMFLLLPFVLWLLQLSLRSEDSFEQLRQVESGWLVRLVLAGLAWALLHHALAGLRYLALDLHWGLQREQARRSAWVVFVISVPLALLAALAIFGVL